MGVNFCLLLKNFLFFRKNDLICKINTTLACYMCSVGRISDEYFIILQIVTGSNSYLILNEYVWNSADHCQMCLALSLQGSEFKKTNGRT